MGQPVHKFLEEFPSAEPRAPEQVVLPLRPRSETRPVNSEPAWGSLREAYECGQEEGRAAMRAEADSEREAMRADFERQLADMRQSCSETLAQLLAAGVVERLDRLHATLVEQAAAALMPVMRHALTEAAVRELVSALDGIARDGEAVSIELSGPDDLLDRVWSRFCELRGGRGATAAPEVRFAPGATTEVRVTVGECVIESRLMQWISNLAEAAG